MRLSKFLKLSIATFFAFPIVILSNQNIFAKNSTNLIEFNPSQQSLIACGGGGGGGGMSPAARKAAKEKREKIKLKFKQRKAAEKAAKGETLTEEEQELLEMDL